MESLSVEGFGELTNGSVDVGVVPPVRERSTADLVALGRILDRYLRRDPALPGDCGWGCLYATDEPDIFIDGTWSISDPELDLLNRLYRPNG